MAEDLKGLLKIFSGSSVDALFVSSPDAQSEALCKSLKRLIDSSVKISSRSFGPLTELLTEDVDSETIWEEIQTRNRPVIRYCKKEIAKSLKNEVDNTVENESESDGNEIVKGAEEYSESGIDSEESFAGSGENESGKSAIDNHNFELNLRQREDALLQDSMSDDSASIDAPMGDEEEDEMEKFLDHADDLEEKFLRKVELLEKKSKGHRGLLELDEEDDYDDAEANGEIDDMLFVQNELYNTDGDEDEKGDIRYNDFFDEPPVSKRGKSGKLPTKTHGSVDSGDEDVDWDYGEDDYLDGEDLDGQALLAPTAHSIRSNKMNEQIALLEHELVTPKSWDLKGEVQAGDRPENSLLGIVADIDRSSKPAPIITQQYTDSIEDMIKKRIKEDNFDDIVPREATEEKRFAEEKEDFQLSQEKNKDGLADVYAKEFLKKTVQYNQSSSELQDKYDEVGSLFDKVCRQLDALSHFYYQPKPVTKEAKITSVQTEHVGSISLEDIVPVTESNGITVAPEEVCAKKHGRESRLLSKEELSSDDRQRMRRTKKSIDKKEKNMKKYEEKMVARLNPGMGNKYEKEKTLSIIRNDKRVLMSDDNRSRKKMSNAVESAGSGGTTSSTMLFKQLQDEAIQSIDSKRINQDAKKKKALHA